MKKRTLIFVTVCCLAPTMFSRVQAQTSGSLVADAKPGWAAISSNIVKAAEKMPEEEYSFRPATTVRSYGQLIGHIIDAHYLFCGPLSAESKTPPDAEKKLTSKADLVKTLKESVGYCNAAIERLTDAQAAETVKFFGRDKARLSVLYMNIAHDNEHYGNLVKYLRIKGLVPPSSEPRQTSRLGRLYFDLAHGQFDPPPPMSDLANRLGVEISSSKDPISLESLKGSRLLYLRAPSKPFAPQEKEAIVGYVKQGGALLLVLDEESRQSLTTTGVNDLIAPFGMKLTPDTPYLHNCGAVAKAGEFIKADREIPYSGGRAVEGGTPFAYQLDQNGKPAQPFAAWKKVDSGGRIIVMGEGMASLFLGVPEGQRLTGKPRDPQGTTYWGRDSAVFMEEVIAWLVNR
jgi:uncharacterized damage-inducible protein DinB